MTLGRVDPDQPAPHPKSRGAARRALRRGPTIDDVAEAAGVSRGTVSRVLNGGRYVSPTALAAVHRAVSETGYVVNQSARSLVTRKSNCVAFVLSEPQERLFSDPNFDVLLRGATQALAARDFSLVLMMASTDDERTRVLRYARSGHVDGVLLVSTHGGDPIFDLLEQGGVPTVACGRPLGHEAAMPYVAADDRQGARLMTRYLLAQGRCRVGHVTGPLDTSGGQERLAGYTDVLGEGFRPDRVVSATDYSLAAGEQAMARLLAAAPDLDAVFAGSDLLAAGALRFLRREGIAVPDRIAVGGFDDSRIALTTDPPLTTVHQPLDRVATGMADLLLTSLEHRPVAPVVLTTELVRRGSA